MAYAFINSVLKQATSGTGSGTSAATNMSGADLIVGIVAYSGSGGTGSISDSLGNVYTSAVLNSVQGPNCALFYCQAPTVSSSMTFHSAAGSSCAIAVAGYSGSAASPLDLTSSGNSSASLTCGTGSVTITAGELVVFGIATNSTATTITCSPGTKRQANKSGFAEGIGIGDIIGGSAGSQSSTWTLSSTGANDAVIASFKPAAGASGKLFVPPNLDGIGAGGPFFADRLAMMRAPRLVRGWRRGIVSDLSRAA